MVPGVSREEMDDLQFIFSAIFMPMSFMIHNICVGIHDKQCLYLVSMIDNIIVWSP